MGGPGINHSPNPPLSAKLTASFRQGKPPGRWPCEGGKGDAMSQQETHPLVSAIAADVARGSYDGAAVIVAQGGKVLLREAVGFASRKAERAAAIGDVFLLMSLSKAFVATTILKLAEEGRLSLLDRVADHVPEFGVKGKGDVRIFHLLTHTGGTWARS